MIWETADNYKIEAMFGDTDLNPDHKEACTSPRPMRIWVRVFQPNAQWALTSINSLATIKRIITCLTLSEFYDWLQEQK